MSAGGEACAHGRSMMERLTALEYPAELLTVQHRMHPEIVAFPNRVFYDGRLTTEYTATEYTSADGAVRPYQVVNVDADCEPIGTSYVNRAEVSACARLCEELAATFEKVVVISPYQAQTRQLLAEGLHNVHTVDSFQGQEADAVVLSVRDALRVEQ